MDVQTGCKYLELKESSLILSCRCLVDHSSALSSGLCRQVYGSTMDQSELLVLELYAQDSLYQHFGVYCLFDDEGLCKDEREGKSMETGRIQSAGLVDRGTGSERNLRGHIRIQTFRDV